MGVCTPAAWELYDLQSDPQELNNLYGHPQYESVAKQLKEELYSLKEKYEDQDEDYPEIMMLRDKKSLD